MAKENSTKKLQLSEKEHIFVCELMMGCIPKDKNWVTGLPVYEDFTKKTLEKYPELDKSFFEKHNAHGINTKQN